MSSTRSMVWGTLAACAALLLSQGAAQAASKCVSAMSKDGAKVAATKGKDIGGCIKSNGGANCITTDSGAVGATASKVSADFDKNCAGVSVGVPGVPTGTAAAISNAAVDNEEQLFFSIYGPSPATSSDKAAAKCQATVNKTYEKAVATYLKGFQACIKSQNDEAGLQSCVGSDPGGKGAAALGKVTAGIDKACAGQDTDALFPGTCVGEDLATCVGNRVRCYSCRMENGMHGLHGNCDLLDDGSANGSCAAGLVSTCNLTNSTFAVQPALGTINVPAVGSIEIATGGDSGVKAASCNIRSVQPFNLAGVGFVCLAGATGCPNGRVDCDGGSTGGTALSANSNLASCTGNADCTNKCKASCPGGKTLVSGWGCEGFCNKDGSACTTDAECASRGAGACYGQDAVPFGNVCQCICLEDALGSVMESGEIVCQLGVAITVEVASPCDGNDVLIDFGSICTPLTTGPSSTSLNNFNKQAGNNKFFVGNGDDPTCFEYDAGNVSGTTLQGGVTFFGSTLGDLLTGVTLNCQ